MNGVPHDGVCKGHGTPARFLGTTQKEGLLFSRFHEDQWGGWASTFFLVILTSVVLYSSLGEARGFSADLMKEHLSPQHQMVNPHPDLLIAERASSSIVGTIMALLATFDEAGILPPEGTPQANQVIHALIQLQSTLMKSTSPELAAYRIEAEAFWRRQHSGGEGGDAGDKGLTAKVLGAFIAYDQEHSLWAVPKVVLAMQEFNVTRADWVMIVDLFHQAEAVFRQQGRSLYDVFEVWRISMPGGKS
jgi:hypothetical protein